MNDSPLPSRLRAAIRDDRRTLGELSRRDAILTLLDVYSLHLAPIEELDGAEEWQHEPGVAEIKRTLEQHFHSWLGGDEPVMAPADVTDAFRAVAHEGLVPPVYEWLADEADRSDLIEFLAYEGGPDADFDDLVALCQVGLSGLPKLTLAANYWDEMGRGSLPEVHTELHRQMADVLRMRRIPLEHLPLEALERKALNGYLATNRALQPEMLGSLGLLECQAGPRCRRVVAALQRLGVPAAALHFYTEHATADPRHGKDWIDGAIAPIVQQHPAWGPRILRGAKWRASVNQAFFAVMAERFGIGERAA